MFRDPRGDSLPTDPDLAGGLLPWRRVVHAGTGVALAGIMGLGIIPEVWLAAGLGTVATAALITDLVRLRLPELNRRLLTVLRRLVAPREARRLASSTWYAVGVCMVVVLFPSEVWIPSVLVTALADPSAAICGQLAGGTPGRPSWAGTAAFAVMAWGCMAPFAGALPAGVAALAAAAVERAPVPLDDNLTVPLVTAVALVLLAG